MPVSAIQALVPLSSTWTHQKVATAVRVLTNELDNEKIQNSNLRTAINIAVSHIAQLINMAQEPWYQVVWKIALENTPHFTGLQWVDLSTKVTPTAATANTGQVIPQPTPNVTTGDVIPANLLWEVKNIVASKSSGQSAVANVKIGNCQRLSFNEIANLQDQFNDQYRHSICWVHSGSEIYFHIGSQISASGTDYVTPGQFSIRGTRNPLLDNLLGEQTTGTGWTQLVDVPDRHMRLVILLAQKMALSQLNKAETPAADNDIAQLSNLITQNVIGEVQHEELMRNKKDQGFNNR